MKPAIRDKVLALDNNHCQYPNCFEVGAPHHIKFRSEGGTDSPDNLITLCMKHHEWVHEGHKMDGVWQSGRKWMLAILAHHAQWKTNFRWRKVRTWLKDCEARHEIGGVK